MLYFVAAHDRKLGMGLNGQLPWPRMAADIERFHTLTKDKTVLMGEKTYREYQNVKHAFGVGNIYVASRSVSTLSDAEVITELDHIVQISKSEDVWVIGGGSIFKQLIEFVDSMYLTRIEGEFQVDTYFPRYSLDEWQVKEETFLADESNPYPYTFLELEKSTGSQNFLV